MRSERARGREGSREAAARGVCLASGAAPATKEVALAFAGLTASAADDKQLFEDDDRGIPEGEDQVAQWL